MQSGQHVLENAAFLKHAGALEGPQQAKLDDLMRHEAIQKGRTITNAAAGRLEKAGDDVKGSGLSSTVGSDQANDLACLHGKSHVGNRDQAAEVNGDAIDRKDDVGLLPHVRGAPVSISVASTAEILLRREKRSSIAGMMPRG